MRDVFYTIVVVWILYKIMNGIKYFSLKQDSSKVYVRDNKNENINSSGAESKSKKQKRFLDSEGEYVDYEEIK